jgi:hypothetical protein
MSERYLRLGGGVGAALLLLAAARGGTPSDAPASNEPRVPVARCLSAPGLVESQGNFQHWLRVGKGDVLHSRDILVALPGFKVDVEPDSKAVKLTLWGNLPGLSDSPALESEVVLHDSRAYDLDFTLVSGRVVLTNTKEKGAAKVWLRGETGVQIVLPQPGDSAAFEIYGRWPAGVPFVPKPRKAGKPLRVWEVFCLKGTVEIKAAKTEWYMAAPPGLAYFHGDNVDGPSPRGPEKRASLPAWADPAAPRPKLAELIDDVIKTYSGRLKSNDPDQIDDEILALAEKDTNKDRARVMRYLIVHAMQALDEIDNVAEVLATSKHPEMRKAAVVALRHWIGEKEGRDDRLYELLQNEQGYSAKEAATVMQLLHSPFDRDQPETYETLITYLKHNKQAVRELAHWHLVRLAPIGDDIPFDAAGPAEEREKAAAAWKERVPAGTLPKDKPDDGKTKGDK